VRSVRFDDLAKDPVACGRVEEYDSVAAKAEPAAVADRDLLLAVHLGHQRLRPAVVKASSVRASTKLLSPPHAASVQNPRVSRQRRRLM
jgi:hypothetical protein